MQSFQTLISEHEHLETLCLKLTAAVRQEKQVSYALALRGDLSQALEEHLSGEDASLYAQESRACDRDFRKVASDFSEDFSHLASAWADYLYGWDAESIHADWEGFADETSDMMQRIIRRIFEENSVLYPLALEKGLIRLRAAVGQPLHS